MRITFDPVKIARNIDERDLPFERVADLDWDVAVIKEDVRKFYGERRFQVFAPLAGRLHVVVITRRGDVVHVISFRKANDREQKYYGENKG